MLIPTWLLVVVVVLILFACGRALWEAIAGVVIIAGVLLVISSIVLSLYFLSRRENELALLVGVPWMVVALWGLLMSAGQVWDEKGRVKVGTLRTFMALHEARVKYFHASPAGMVSARVAFANRLRFGETLFKFFEDVRHFPSWYANAASSVWLVVYFKEPYAAFSYSTVFGDLLYNLRSSLDALIYALIRKDGGSGNRRTCFPIYADSVSYESHTKPGSKADVLVGVSDDARTLVKQLQPFMRGGGTATLDPLHLLNLMCNRDKHEAAHLMLGYAKEVEFQVHFGDGQVVRCASDGPLIGHGPWQVTVPMPVTHVEPNHRIEVAGRSDFLIAADAPWQGRAVLDLGHTLLGYVEDNVVSKFRPLFA